MYHLTNGTLLLAISTFLLSIYTCSAQEHVINVNATNGTDTDSCLQGRTPCATINMALNGSSFNGIGITTLYISPGNYTLENADFNNINGVVGSSFAIIGSGELETRVECDSGAGLNISSFYEVTIQSISFIGCGFENKLAISFKIYHLHNRSYTETIVHASPAAMTFTSCEIVSVYNVTVLVSNGSGIIMIDSEQASIIGCTVSLGYYLASYSGSLALGGIVHLSSDFNRRTELSIAHSTITDNNYLLGNEDCRIIQATGAIVAAGEMGTINLDINSCLIVNNSRGLFFYHLYCISTYEFSNTIISNNQIASTMTSYNECTRGINVFVVDTEMADTHPLIINLLEQQSTSASIISVSESSSLTTAFSDCSTVFCSFIDPFQFCSDQNKRAEINISNPSIFSFEIMNRFEECRDTELQPECIGYDCSNFYSVCSVKEEDCKTGYDEIDNCFCYDNHFNETNNCGECIEGHSVAINSPYLECVPCNRSLDVLKGWVILIVLEFIPLTVMLALIAILNVNLNQGSLKAYILFCQLFTIPIPSSGYPSWVESYNFTYRLRDFALLPFTIWNLGFVIFPSCNLYSGGNECSDFAICISQNTTPLGAIAFWYVIAFYPFLLLASLYGFVILYNKGYKRVVCTGRPVHRLLARFWRRFDIQPSFCHTIASAYLLCFTQIVAISSKIFRVDNHNFFLYDGSQKYVDVTHVVALLAGLFVLIVFVFLPVAYLCVYPFKWFQKGFNKLKFKKDLLISVTDVFIGPYKNGTNDTWDYRFFAGLVFALQLSQLMFFSLNVRETFQIIHLLLGGLYVILIIILRPYKNLLHSLTEVFLYLSLIGFSSFPIVYKTMNQKRCIGKDTVDTTWVACISILYFILIIVCFYCFVWIIKKVKYAVSHRAPHRTEQPQQPVNDHEVDTAFNKVEEDDGEFADRLMNPQSYDERHVPNMPFDNGEKLTAPYKRI